MTALPPLKNQTYDDQDRNSIQYQGNWFFQGTYNATHTHQTGTLTSTNDVTANFTFVFPQAAYGFYYYGIRRSHGASYQVCVDCDPEDMQWVDIPNTRNATDDGKNPPVVLYSQTWDTPDVHRVIITNRPDPNFNNTSQLTIDRIDLLVKDPLAPATPPPEASASGGSSTTAAIASAPSNSTMNNAVSSNSGGASNAALIGGILGGVAVAIILCVVLTIVFLGIRKRRQIKKARIAKKKVEEEFHSRGDDLAFAASTFAPPMVLPYSYKTERAQRVSFDGMSYNPPSTVASRSPDYSNARLFPNEKLRPVGPAPVPMQTAGNEIPSYPTTTRRESDYGGVPPRYSESMR